MLSIEKKILLSKEVLSKITNEYKIVEFIQRNMLIVTTETQCRKIKDWEYLSQSEQEL